MKDHTPLFKASQLTQIPVADKPLRLGGKISYLNPAEFKQRYGCEYTESVWLANELLDKQKKQLQTRILPEKVDVDQITLQAKIADRLQNPCNKFVLCHIDDEVGTGLFAREMIPENTVILLYTGVLSDITSKANKGDDYLYRLGESQAWGVSSLHMGGLARFCQHLPLDFDKERQRRIQQMCDPHFLSMLLAKQGTTILPEDIPHYLAKKKMNKDNLIATVEKNLEADKAKDPELDRYTFFEPNDRMNVATANILIELSHIQGYPVIAMISSRRVEAGEQLGYTYGQHYWQQSTKTLRLFTEQGQLIPLNKYQCNETNITLQPPGKAYSVVLPGKRHHWQSFLEMGQPLTHKEMHQGSKEEEYSLSHYRIRDALCRHNVISPARYGIIENTFTLILQQHSLQASVRGYYRHPDKDTDDIDAHIIDVVCESNHRGYLDYLHSAFTSQASTAQRFFKTNEVVIQDVNTPLTSKMATAQTPERILSTLFSKAPVHRKWVQASQGGIVRLDLCSEPETLGAFTQSIRSCLGIVIKHTKAPKRLCLMHVDFTTDPDCLRQEVDWVSMGMTNASTVEILFFKNQAFVDEMAKSPGLRGPREDFDTEARFLCGLREQGLIKRLRQRYNISSGKIAINRQGELSYTLPPENLCLTKNNLSSAILFFNGQVQCIGRKMHDAYIEYTHGRYSAAPIMTVPSKIVLNMLFSKLYGIGINNRAPCSLWDLYAEVISQIQGTANDLSLLGESEKNNTCLVLLTILKHCQDYPDYDTDARKDGRLYTVNKNIRDYPCFDVAERLFHNTQYQVRSYCPT